MYHVNDFAYNIKEMLDFLKKIGYYIRQTQELKHDKVYIIIL